MLYDINDQLVDPFREIHDAEPRTTGNHGTSKRAEKAAIKKLVNSSRFLLPVHDRPCKIEGGYVVVGHLFGLTPEFALALSLIKRVRDIVIGLPALALWQVMEGRRLLIAPAAPKPGAETPP